MARWCGDWRRGHCTAFVDGTDHMCRCLRSRNTNSRTSRTRYRRPQVVDLCNYREGITPIASVQSTLLFVPSLRLSLPLSRMLSESQLHGYAVMDTLLTKKEGPDCRHSSVRTLARPKQQKFVSVNGKRYRSDIAWEILPFETEKHIHPQCIRGRIRLVSSATFQGNKRTSTSL